MKHAQMRLAASKVTRRLWSAGSTSLRTVATADEPPMNSQETHEVAAYRPARTMLGLCAGTALLEYGGWYGEPGSAGGVDRGRGCPPHRFRPRVPSDSRRDQGLWLCVPI